MELSKKETYRNKKVSLGVTLLSFVVMLLFFIFTNVITANPVALASSAFVASPQILLSMEAGSSEVLSDTKHLGDNTLSSNPKLSSVSKTTDAEIPFENGVQSAIDRYKNAHFVTVPNETSDISEPATSKANDLNSTLPAGPQMVSPSMLFSLGKRSIVGRPALTTTTQDEGTVVVDITVDKTGKVIDANPNGRGTTTNNPALKGDAAKIAFATKFSADQTFEEQRGTITIIYLFD
ncbi:hypothetical protein CNR22_18020 [Sphingobacteriaceae bacterium]|nr:hypothetical protein CNR22_18020 [Sphingobacteriaceae bacterium]